MRSGGSGQWVTVALGDVQEGHHLALPLLVQVTRLRGQTVLVALCSDGAAVELTWPKPRP
jgi:hypothetical protein